ncbi:MAG: helix-turn-helix transcriptional regulator [Pseudobacteriovorax sp.]|nr:helix-turn-helix transcriptional regulator [Pseudobacteriovorax sp.]
MKTYQDIYPTDPLLKSSNLNRFTVSELLNFEYFEADPGEMPTQVFDQHHVLVNLNETSHRVENWRNGQHRDFIYHQNDVIVTPAGLESGWRWHAASKVVVVTLEPKKFESFALHEVGVVLSKNQVRDIPKFNDENLTTAARLALEALHNGNIGDDIVFESLARDFLIKLIQKYGDLAGSEAKFSKGFSSIQFKKVLDFIKQNYSQTFGLDELAKEAGISRHHFSRLFKETTGRSPMQFVLEYRVQKAKLLLSKQNVTLSEIAAQCGFSDQAHFSRAFKAEYGRPPKSFRK